MTLKKEARKIAFAVLIAMVAVLLVIAFVAGQEPSRDRPALKAPATPALAAARTAIEPAEPPVPQLQAVDTPPKPPAPQAPEVAKKPEVPARAEAPKPLPRKTMAPKPRPKPPRRVRRAPPPKPVEERMVSPSARGEGFKVKFRSLKALEALVEGDHVAVVVEYPDGARLLLPRELDGELVTIDVPSGAFTSWVDERRVSELQPTPALLDRLRVHARDVRYLAVLSPEIRDAIAREAERARVNADRSVMVIDEDAGHPEVSVLLARR